MLAAMFSGRHELDTDSEGRYFIDRDGKYFKYILNFLRDGNQLPSADLALEVRIGPAPEGGGGWGLPYERDEDACRTIRIKTLKETNLSVAQALFEPTRRPW